VVFDELKTELQVQVAQSKEQGTGQSNPVECMLLTDSALKDLACPGCHYHLRIRVLGEQQPDTYHVSSDDEEEEREAQAERVAFMACLWGPVSEESGHKVTEKILKYCHDAIILGYCLARHCVHQKRVLLVTSDMLRFVEVQFLNQYWELRQVSHLKVHSSRLHNTDPSYRSGFTKLRALEQTDFAKVILFDLDVIVVRSIDEVFGFDPPYALFQGKRGHSAGTGHPGQTLSNKPSHLHGAMVLLKPSSENFHYLASKVASKGPERDFLSLYNLHLEKWKQLPVKYNWQPHRLRYLTGHMPDDKGEPWVPVEDVSAIHFSGGVRPRDYYFGAFDTFWRDEAPLDFVNFQQDLVSYYAGGDWMSVEHRERAWKAIGFWKRCHEEAWRATVTGAKGHFDGRCPLCHHTPDDLEHCFFQCVKAKEMCAVWRHHSGDKSCSKILALLDSNPRDFAYTLKFVAAVSVLRHPYGHLGCPHVISTTKPHYGKGRGTKQPSGQGASENSGRGGGQDFGRPWSEERQFPARNNYRGCKHGNGKGKKRGRSQ